jgi:hypothetical protein
MRSAIGSGARPVGDIDLHDAGAIEQTQCPFHRDVDNVVQVEPQHLSLCRHDAHDTIGFAADADKLAQRVFVTEQFLLDLVPQYRPGLWITFSAIGQ